VKGVPIGGKKEVCLLSSTPISGPAPAMPRLRFGAAGASRSYRGLPKAARVVSLARRVVPFLKEIGLKGEEFLDTR